MCHKIDSNSSFLCYLICKPHINNLREHYYLEIYKESVNLHANLYAQFYLIDLIVNVYIGFKVSFESSDISTCFNISPLVGLNNIMTLILLNLNLPKGQKHNSECQHSKDRIQ